MPLRVLRLVAIWILVAMIATPSVSDTTGAFKEPWKNTSAALLIDPFYGNSIDWEKITHEPRLVAIIHKATIGVSSLDPKYLARRSEAKRRGYLWGSYHWALPGNPVQQADFYIDTVQPTDDEVIALDLEDVSSGKFMNIEDAGRFIARVKERTGRYPMVYANHKTAALISKSPLGPAFAEAPLWYARFRPDIPDFPRGVWTTYTLWQFSSEIRVQYRIPGIRYDMDINVYNGTVEDLRRAWPFTRR